MKLYRFVAQNTHRAIFTVNDVLGPDALIYSTRKVSDGIEILAGLPLDKHPVNEKDVQMVEVDKITQREMKQINRSVDYRLMEGFKSQMEMMNDNIQALANNVENFKKHYIAQLEKKRFIYLNFYKMLEMAKLFTRHLSRHAFRIRHKTVE